MDTIDRKKQYLQDFLDEIVWHEPWFKELHKKNLWDLFVLSGSFIRDDVEPDSDVDLFLVLPHKVQADYNVSPIHLYSYKGNEIEISKITTEKLIRGATDKRDLHWWYRARIIRSNSEDIERVFHKASSISKEETKTLLWTNYCVFQIRYDFLRKTLKRGDYLGAFCCFYNVIDLVMEVVLNAHEIFVTVKKKGSYLKNIDSELYNRLLSFIQNPSSDFEKECREMELMLVRILKGFGFSSRELDLWDRHNLHRFLHQAL